RSAGLLLHLHQPGLLRPAPEWSERRCRPGLQRPFGARDPIFPGRPGGGEPTVTSDHREGTLRPCAFSRPREQAHFRPGFTLPTLVPEPLSTHLSVARES